jgi:hypothetical protein
MKRAHLSIAGGSDHQPPPPPKKPARKQPRASLTHAEEEYYDCLSHAAEYRERLKTEDLSHHDDAYRLWLESSIDHQTEGADEYRRVILTQPAVNLPEAGAKLRLLVAGTVPVTAPEFLPCLKDVLERVHGAAGRPHGRRALAALGPEFSEDGKEAARMAAKLSKSERKEWMRFGETIIARRGGPCARPLDLDRLERTMSIMRTAIDASIGVMDNAIAEGQRWESASVTPIR